MNVDCHLGFESTHQQSIPHLLHNDTIHKNQDSCRKPYEEEENVQVTRSSSMGSSTKNGSVVLPIMGSFFKNRMETPS